MKKTFNFIYNYKIQTRTDIYHLFLSKLIGKSFAYKFLILKYNFKLKWQLFFRESKSFWIGKSLNQHCYEITWINPDVIKYQIKDGDVPYIQDGNWDLKKLPFKLNDAILERYVYDPPIPIKKTKQYKLMSQKVENGQKVRGCSNLNDVYDYFLKMDKLFSDLNSGQYLTQEELNIGKVSSNKFRYPNEIIVSVDRDGNFLHERGGSHRLSMAKVIKLTKIPVVIIRKHLTIFKKEQSNDNTF
tara:strand:+ start:771 stop:1499 length:729 start_codon:yes stop_codon:yes gene_type:complete